MLKNVLLRLNFEDEGHLYANLLLCILLFIENSFFSVLDLWHRWHIHILTGVQKEPISFWENDHILLKKVRLKRNVKVEDHLSACCFVFSLTIYHKSLLFQFLGCGIRIQIPILTEVEKARIGGWKDGHFLLKKYIF